MYRVLRIANRLNLGGPTYNVAYLTRYLDNDFETLLVAGNTDETEESSAYIVEDLGIQPRYIDGMYRELHPWKDRKALSEIRHIIREYKPHIVHTHAAKAGALGRTAAILEKVPVIVHTFHGHVFHSYFGPLKTRVFLEIERALARKSDQIIALSQLQKEELCQQYRVAPCDKFAVVPLGFDLSRFVTDSVAKRQAYRTKYQIRQDEIAIGIIGRLVPVKNHRLFLEAVKYISGRTEKKIKALIIGGGEERGNIENMARELKIDFTTEKDIVHDKPLIFTSWEKNVDEALAGLDIVLLTSHNEGTPVSLIEASASGKPVVTTDVGGIKNVLKQGENAFILPKDDFNGFCNKVLALIKDENLRLSMGTKGQSETLRQYSYSRLCGDMSELYRKLLHEKGVK